MGYRIVKNIQSVVLGRTLPLYLQGTVGFGSQMGLIWTAVFQNAKVFDHPEKVLLVLALVRTLEPTIGMINVVCVSEQDLIMLLLADLVQS